MPYNIIFKRGERELGKTPWNESFEKAKEHAIFYGKVHNADRVEIRDDDGNLVFQHPRTITL